MLVGKSWCFSWLRPTWRLDKSCCWGGDLSAVRRGKVAVVGGGVCLVPGFAQIADHLTHNSPFLPFFGEVVCTLGGTLPYESHSCRRCADSTLLMPPRPPNHPGGGYHRARECSSSAQRPPGSKLMPRGHSANSEWSIRPCAGLTSSDATRQHRVFNSPNLLIGAWARLPAYGIAGPRADERTQLRNCGPACGREESFDKSAAGPLSRY